MVIKMKIVKLEVSAPFMYLWLKSVEGVDLGVHCAKCIIGKYDNRISAKMREACDIELSSETYYLCGVSKPYLWENNFHLAFTEKEGARIEVERNGIAVIIEGAEEIKFSEKDINFNLPQAKKKEFYTCRNWQFANKFYKLNK